MTTKMRDNWEDGDGEIGDKRRDSRIYDFCDERKIQSEIERVCKI